MRKWKIKAREDFDENFEFKLPSHRERVELTCNNILVFHFNQLEQVWHSFLSCFCLFVNLWMISEEILVRSMKTKSARLQVLVFVPFYILPPPWLDNGLVKELSQGE